MKVALFYSKLDYGGIQRISILLANALVQKDGLEVDMVLARAEGDMLSMLSPKVRVIDLNCGEHDRITRSYDLNFYLPSSSFVQYLKREKPDILLSLGAVCNRIAALVKLLYKMGFILVMSEHNTLGTVLEEHFGICSKWGRKLLTRILYRVSDCCVCVSQGVADDLVRLKAVSEEKIRVIYCPVIGDDFFRELEEAVSHPWLEPDQWPVIISFGRLVKQKALDILIKAFDYLRSSLGCKARLMIIGLGPEKESLEALVKSLGLESEVCFEGFVEHVFPYVARSALMVLSSLHEGMPSALIEALACGTNVVSMDCPSGPREILEGGKWGWLVPVGDVEALGQAMKEALYFPLPSEELKRRGAFFSVGKSVEEYYGLFNTLYQERRK